MLDSLRCQSAEKLVLDAEGIAMAQRLLRGVAPRRPRDAHQVDRLDDRHG